MNRSRRMKAGLGAKLPRYRSVDSSSKRFLDGAGVDLTRRELSCSYAYPAFSLSCRRGLLEKRDMNEGIFARGVGLEMSLGTARAGVGRAALGWRRAQGESS